MKERQEFGFTLIEVMLVAALLIPCLGAFVSASRYTLASMGTSDGVSEASVLLRRTVESVNANLLPARLSTLQVRAVQADVDAAIAAGAPVPFLGDWIPMPELDPRPAIQFELVTGTTALGGATSRRSLELVLETGEDDDGIDDDGDGLVDESVLQLRRDGQPVVLLRNVESCSFELEGRELRVSLQSARRNQGRIQRASITAYVCIRNQ